MIDVCLTYTDINDFNRLIKADIKTEIFIHHYKSDTITGRSKSNKLKFEWGAKQDPFILVTDKNVPLKCFYSEQEYEYGNDIIDQLITYLNKISK